jgi:plasmid stabilization system protein ParE
VRSIILATAQKDANWFRRYYSENFPEGRSKANKRLRAARLVIETHPLAGHLRPNGQSRSFVISGTPFSLEYVVLESFIGILRIRDQRSDPSRLSGDDLR